MSVTGLPLWAEYLFWGIYIFFSLIFSGIAVAKTGRNPMWALLMAVPLVQIVALWVFAFVPWPLEKKI